MTGKPRRPIRQWVVDNDSPYIERTPEEAQAFFKRRREAAGRKLRERAEYISAGLEKDRLLKAKGYLDA
jgi:hypothetical protein